MPASVARSRHAATRPAAVYAPRRDRGVHLPGLGAVRAVAALAVVVHHIEQFKAMLGWPNAWRTPWVAGIGPAAVSLFFVLSGFLITFLLLIEMDDSGTVDVTRFYARRALRIWPAYYLVVGFSFLTLPALLPAGTLTDAARAGTRAGWANAALFLTLLPNVAAAAFPMVLGASQAWSIGVEEQFYLAWPLVVRSARRHLPVVLLVVALGKLALDLEVWRVVQAAERLGVRTPVTTVVERVVASLRIDRMAWGAVAAWLVVRGRLSGASFLFHPAMQLAAAAVALTTIPSDRVLTNLAQSVAFALLVASISCAPRSVLTVENRAVRWLGDVSYGIYMYHASVTLLLFGALGPLVRSRADTVLTNVLAYGGAVTITLLVAGASYRWVERPFLRLKARFAVVPSAP